MTCTFWVAVSKGTVAPEGWLHMDLVENEKLEWTRETPQGTNTSQKVCVCVCVCVCGGGVDTGGHEDWDGDRSGDVWGGGEGCDSGNGGGGEG